VCATAKETKGTTRLRSYESISGFDVPATILEAALATSAASSYFDPVIIGSRTFVDGGLRANNPVEQVEEEASDIWCETSGSLQPLVKCFISIGTGNPGKKALENNIAKFLSKSLVEIATETEATAERFVSRWREPSENHRYFRYNVDQGLQEVDLAEYKSANVIETTTSEYMGEQRQESSVLHCVQNLKQKESVYIESLA
jgi:predicted acylesterase/phospholipase RssA